MTGRGCVAFSPRCAGRTCRSVIGRRLSVTRCRRTRRRRTWTSDRPRAAGQRAAGDARQAATTSPRPTLPSPSSSSRGRPAYAVAQNQTPLVADRPSARVATASAGCHVEEVYSQHACAHCERAGGPFAFGPRRSTARSHGLQ
eukprot:5401753-Prymnesium_polylepis.1